ncbi:hypothetical protein M8818_007357 [Zalaria obscura]|uniref:Uncharacterized protein n=1 Tax=Zalaria obscura TaxID=2024903 RepID=A0ACC3S4T1_9PEZI
MPDFKNLAKGGWHPEKRGGGKEGGLRSEFKGVNTVAGWMGKGKDPYEDKRADHQSAPLSSLRDPSSFAPPPKHVQYYGAAAAQSSSTPSPPPPPRSLGSALPPQQIHQQQEAERAAAQAAEEEANRPRPPPGPYRPDTTGLSTAHLPKPPVRRLDSSSPAPAPAPATRRPAGPPGLPPRLPPRQNSNPDEYSAAPPPNYHEATQSSITPNQGALNRLGQAGVSVPGFNIGRTASPPKPSPSPPVPPRTNSPALPNRGPQVPQLNELQSRFSRMNTSSPNPPQPVSPGQSQGTTWAQKQSAINTAQSFRRDPSSVPFSDARAAVGTANNFRERHGDQITSGLQTANGLQTRFGAGTTASPPASPAIGGVAGKKPPPPPPPKKKELSSGSGAPEPPPVPLSSKPR